MGVSRTVKDTFLVTSEKRAMKSVSDRVQMCAEQRFFYGIPNSHTGLELQIYGH